MAFQPVNDTAQFRIQFQGTLGGELADTVRAEFSLYVRNTINPWATTTLQAMADAIRDEVDASGIPLLGAAWSFIGVVARDLEDEFSPVMFAAGAGIGTRAGQTAPPSVCPLVKVLGDAGGAPRFGLVHPPYGVEADLDVDAWTSAFVNAVSAHIEDIRTAIAGTGVGNAMVIVSRFNGTEPDPDARRSVKRAAGVTNTTSTISTRNRIGSMRERRT